MRRRRKLPEGMERWTDDFGNELLVHAKIKCKDQDYCSIHKPTQHIMTDMPRYYRPDRSLMERICEHGIGHPDPDHMRFLREQVGIASMLELVHGCCGCCMNRRFDEPTDAKTL